LCGERVQQRWVRRLSGEQGEVQKDRVWVGEGFARGQRDESSQVQIEPPFGHDDNMALANTLGIVSVYEYTDMGSTSRITVAFQSRENANFDDVEAFVVADGEAKLQQVPNGKIALIRFPDDVTQHFKNLGMPFSAHSFDSNTEGISDTLAFTFETPGGFWTLGWNVAAELFRQEPDLFFLFIQSIRVTPRNVSGMKADGGASA